MKVYGPDGEKEQSSRVRMLLLVQNEIDQIMARSLTRSETHEQTEALLISLRDKVSESDEARFFVCDNANANRNLAERVLGSAVEVKHEPFHVIQRFTDKVKQPEKSKWLASALSSAIYELDGNLRAPSEMEAGVMKALSAVPTSCLGVPVGEWEGCVTSNMNQIRRGDLYVSNNRYEEGGGVVKVVSTSQLEGVHAKLKMLLDRMVSTRVGLRIFDIFALKHNLTTGGKFDRNPVFSSSDVVALSRAAVVCRGIVPDSPQLEYIYKLLNTNANTSFRRLAPDDSIHRPWEMLLEKLKLDARQVGAHLLEYRAPVDDIKRLLLTTYKQHKMLTRNDFVDMLGLEVGYNTSSGFSSQEFKLLRQLRAEERAARQSWSRCTVVATVLFNAAVSQIDNSHLTISTSNFKTVAHYLHSIDRCRDAQAKVGSKFNILKLEYKSIDEFANNPNEEALQKQLFLLLRGSTSLKHRKQNFHHVYEFASCVCADIRPTTRQDLERKWWKWSKKETRQRPSALACGVSDEDSHSTLATSPEKTVCDLGDEAEAKESEPVHGEEAVDLRVYQDNVTDVTSADEGSDAPQTIGSVPNSSASTAASLPANLLPQVMPSSLGNNLRTFLQSMANAIKKGTPGKWKFIHKLYLERNPCGTQTENALRLCLSDHTRSVKRAAPQKPDIQSASPSAAPDNAV